MTRYNSQDEVSDPATDIRTAEKPAPKGVTGNTTTRRRLRPRSRKAQNLEYRSSVSGRREDKIRTPLRGGRPFLTINKGLNECQDKGLAVI